MFCRTLRTESPSSGKDRSDSASGVVLLLKERNKLKTYNCIVFTDFHHTKLFPLQNFSLGFILKVFLKFRKFHRKKSVSQHCSIKPTTLSSLIRVGFEKNSRFIFTTEYNYKFNRHNYVHVNFSYNSTCNFQFYYENRSRSSPDGKCCLWNPEPGKILLVESGHPELWKVFFPFKNFFFFGGGGGGGGGGAGGDFWDQDKHAILTLRFEDAFR